MSKFLGHSGHWNKNITQIEPYSVRWFPTDSEEHYYLRGNKQYDVDSINYCHNQYNFRQKHTGILQFGSKPRLMILGCSITYGIGLPYEELWFNQLQEHFDIYNFAWPGASIEFCLLTLWRFKNIIKPNLIIGILPILERHIQLKHNGDFWLMNDGSEGILKQSYLRMYSNENYRHKLMNMYKIQIDLFKGQTPMLISSWDWHFYNEFEDKFDLPLFEHVSRDDLARDNAHFGKNSHKIFGQKVHNYLLENNFV